MEAFIGRKKEINKIKKAVEKNRSEFIAVYGRRRVGKTMLIKTVFKNNFTFQITGIANVPRVQQLFSFHARLSEFDPANETKPIPKNWFEAFENLKIFIKKSKKNKKVLFFDELPWFDNRGSDFLQSLEHFWNGWATYRDDIVLVVCGSAASWMINKLINHKGGLHNRVTLRMRLEPFNLFETEQFLKLKNNAIDRYQILQIYMVTGGIPFYLDEVDGDLSAAQNIEQLCFAGDGLLRFEFENLFKALFNKADRHIAVVRAIAQKSKGLTRDEIVTTTGLSRGGSTTKILDELEKSGFIRSYLPFKKKKRTGLFQLCDFYTLFYLRFIEKTTALDKNNWINAIDTPHHRTWSGYSFEQICLHHIPQIKKALSIGGVVSYSSSWKSSRAENGAQIDLVIDRRDRVINLFEMKFSIQKFTITKKYAETLENKLKVFKNETKTNKAVYLTFLTTYGLQKNAHSNRLVQRDLTMDLLFEQNE